MGRRKIVHGNDPNLPILCVICGDKARGNNFRVLSCVSCKSFFRRHGLLDLKNRQCRYRGNCAITKGTRSDCLPCRLKKCMKSGMDPLKIRCPPEMQMIAIRKHQQLPMPKPLNLLQNDCSTLTSEQWNLLSNIIHSYDEQNIINSARDMLAEKSSLPLKLRLKTNDTKDFISHLQTNFILFFKRSSDFRHLSIDARRTLMSPNLFFMSTINMGFVAHEMNAYQDTTFMTGFSAFFGSEVLIKCAEDNERYLTNGNLYKTMLMVLLFSSNFSIVDFDIEADMTTAASSRELMQVQDIYVTMLWKYLVYVYGYYGAAMRFTIMIKNVLDDFVKIEKVFKNAAYDTILETCSTSIKRLVVSND